MNEQAPETAQTATLDAENGTRERILATAHDLFCDHGYSRVSTNEIAQSIGISKKSLYKEFETKEDVLRAVILPKLEQARKEMESVIEDQSLSFIEKLTKVMSLISGQHKRVSPVLFKDVYVHVPAVWKLIDAHRKTKFKLAEQLIQQGIDRGSIRSDIDPEILLALFALSLEALMAPAKLEELATSSKEVFRSIMTVFIEGSLTEASRGEYHLASK